MSSRPASSKPTNSAPTNSAPTNSAPTNSKPPNSSPTGNQRPTAPGAKAYVGIDQDRYGGMTPIGGIIKDAWVFELIPESETCAGWRLADIQMLHDRVAKEWDRYGLLISHLPEPLKLRHQRIHDSAIARARDLGWEPGLDVDSAMAHGDEPVLPR